MLLGIFGSLKEIIVIMGFRKRFMKIILDLGYEEGSGKIFF